MQEALNGLKQAGKILLECFPCLLTSDPLVLSALRSSAALQSFPPKQPELKQFSTTFSPFKAANSAPKHLQGPGLVFREVPRTPYSTESTLPPGLTGVFMGQVTGKLPDLLILNIVILQALSMFLIRGDIGISGGGG